MASSSSSTSHHHHGGRSSRHHGSSSKPKPADVAAEAKKTYIPAIRKMGCYPFYSHLFRAPIDEISFNPSNILVPPSFHVQIGDPVDYTLTWQAQERQRLGEHARIPFICAAHEKKVGGEWEISAGGYEEKLCRRSTLAAVLANPAEGQAQPNYPIPMEGGILCDTVVIFRGPHPYYQVLDHLYDLPVVSVHAMPRPKLTHNGSKYSFADERQIVTNKLKAALRIALWQGYIQVVIGDFGLGSYRNPPREMAEIWREVFLYDPQLRGKFRHAAFVFEDPTQSTEKLIADDIAKKSASGAAAGPAGKGKGKAKKEKDKTAGSSASAPRRYPTDYEIFAEVFSEREIGRVINTPDPRLGLGMITS